MFLDVAPHPLQGRFGSRLTCLIEHHEKFFASKAEKLIGSSKAALHDLTDEQVNFITDQVAVTVIDRLLFRDY